MLYLVCYSEHFTHGVSPERRLYIFIFDFVRRGLGSGYDTKSWPQNQGDLTLASATPIGLGLFTEEFIDRRLPSFKDLEKVISDYDPDFLTLIQTQIRNTKVNLIDAYTLIPGASNRIVFAAGNEIRIAELGLQKVLYKQQPTALLHGILQSMFSGDHKSPAESVLIRALVSEIYYASNSETNKAAFEIRKQEFLTYLRAHK